MLVLILSSRSLCTAATNEMLEILLTHLTLQTLQTLSISVSSEMYEAVPRTNLKKHWIGKKIKKKTRDNAGCDNEEGKKNIK